MQLTDFYPHETLVDRKREVYIYAGFLGHGVVQLLITSIQLSISPGGSKLDLVFV